MKNAHWFKCGLVTIFLLLQLPVFSQVSEKYTRNWNDPEIQFRIKSGIEANRMGWFSLEFVDEKDKPLTNASVSIEQIGHEFLFGANIFMYGGFQNQEQNKQYEASFRSLFNYASLPFYWKALEPEQGDLRYGASSKPIYRRPPPEPILEFCRKNEIVAKGHTLVWDNPQWSVPEWLPEDLMLREKYTNTRIKQLGDKFGSEIKYWDVVNELYNRGYHQKVTMPFDFALKAFKQAEQTFPREDVLILNETTHVWKDNADEYSHFYLVAENLLLKGAKIDALGFQCHFFHGDQEFQDVLAGVFMQPKIMLDIMDAYSKLQLPIHITEITIPTLPNNAEGEKAQAIITENLYKIWFSHPNVEAITWWNLVDGTATSNEDKWNGGFLRKDFSPKPSSLVLERLINHEWKTNIVNQKLADSSIKFHGFYGKYKISVLSEGKKTVHEVTLNKQGQRSLTIKVE